MAWEAITITFMFNGSLSVANNQYHKLLLKWCEVCKYKSVITGLTIRNLQCKDRSPDKYVIVRNNM